VVEPISLPPPNRRRAALAEAGYNTFLLRADDVFIDLLTDSGTSALSQEQRLAMELGDESYAGSRSSFHLERAVYEAYGYRHLIPTDQGRGAEHLLARVLIRPGQLVPSNLYFTTSRAHTELAGGVWVDVSIAEASDPSSEHPFKGNIDLVALEQVLAGAAPEGVAFVREEACLNMAGGQPFSIENLRGVRELAHAHGVPLVLDATRIAENALFVKRREPGYGGRTLASIVREITDLSDGAVFLSKKDHFVPIGGLLALTDDALAESARELVVVYEGFPHHGGMAGHDMEALAQGIRESLDEETVAHYVAQSAYLGGLLRNAGIPIVFPIGAHAVFLDAKRFLPHLALDQFPAQALAAAIYLGVRCGRWSEGSSPASTGRGVRRARARSPDDPAPRPHPGAPRLCRRGRRCRLRGAAHSRRLRMTYEPERLRFFQARFAPLAQQPRC
jgi:tyrosine phenol-lyase